MPPASTVILCILVTGAMASDIHRGRIFNCWLVPAFVTGIMIKLYGLYGLYISGAGCPAQALFCGAAGTVLIFILVFIPCLCGGLGAGDVKLVLTGSLFLTFRENIFCLAQAFLLAGILVFFLLAEEAAKACRRRDLPGLLAFLRGRHRSDGIPFAIPYALSVLFLTGGVTDLFWQTI